MDYSIIDELYDIYLNEDIDEAKKEFRRYYDNLQIYGNHDLIQIIEKYIREQSQDLSKYFVSNKDEKNKVDTMIREITAIFDSYVFPVFCHLMDTVYEKEELQQMNPRQRFHEDVKPHDLFNIDIDFIEQAVEEAIGLDEDFEKVKSIILYVKKNNLLKKLYGDSSWRNMNFGELIASLYDKAKDKSVFEGPFHVLTDDFTLFDKVKENCRYISAVSFDKYRATLTSSKQMQVEYGKLIFCKNLLIFYQTGIMPLNDGMIDCSVDFYETLQMLDEFKALYSRKFDEAQFRSEQSNIICKPEIITTDYEIETSKTVHLGNKMIFGIILAAKSSLSDSDYKIPYLIHINIEDINNPCSNYEIQLNLIPNGKIANRLQLVRLDNWASEQPHKNIAKKLTTTTHIHLYNEFDLLRGKLNGNFDIAYNIEGTSTDFAMSLKIFLDILDLDSDLKAKIYNSIIKAIDKNKTTTKTTGV